VTLSLDVECDITLPLEVECDIACDLCRSQLESVQHWALSSSRRWVVIEVSDTSLSSSLTVLVYFLLNFGILFTSSFVVLCIELPAHTPQAVDLSATDSGVGAAEDWGASHTLEGGLDLRLGVSGVCP